MEELTQVLFLKRSNFIKFILLLSFFSLSFLGIVYSIARESINYEKDTFIVDQGSSLNSILNKLETKYLRKLALRIYYKLNHQEIIIYGEYVMNDISYIDFFNDLTSGNVFQRRFVINEGMNIYDLKDTISKLDIINDCINFSCLQNKFDFVEGTLYPDTYFYSVNDFLSTILIFSESRMDSFLDNIWKNRIEDENIKSKEDLLILASIIEKESGNEIDKPLISSVFYNRLRNGMRLQADPTIIYGLLPEFNGDIKKADIYDQTNPYNTYVIDDLPPTPIAIPSKTSLIAASQPSETNFLFFVSKGDGSHYFSVTYNEHLSAISEYQ